MQNMHGLMMFILLIMLLMIYGIGHWVWKMCQQLNKAEVERAEIREVAKTAASDAASCAAVIDKIEQSPKRRSLYAVRDNTSGVSIWKWK